MITARKWDYLKGFLGVFGSCEEDFVNLIDGMYPTEKPVDISSRDSMQLEAQNVFLAVDDLYQVREHSMQGGADYLGPHRSCNEGGIHPVCHTEHVYPAAWLR